MLFIDIWRFLIGTTEDHLALGGWRYLLVLLFLALLAGGIFFAWRNWRDDPEQRTAQHLVIGVMRTLIGCMWFQGMLWKLPLPASEGLRYWTQQEAARASFELHRTLIADFLLPNLALFGPLVFLTELAFAVSLMLGLGVRLVGLIGVVFVAQLWLGIYLPGEPAEWPWSYVFLMMLMLIFSLQAAGRSLGADAWLRREVPAVRDGRGLVGRLLQRVG